MKLQQLRYVVEIVRHGNHLSAAADAMHTSQPGVSRQIQLLEQELGFEIFQRTRNRIIGLTEQGELVLEFAQRITTDAAALKTLKQDMEADTSGTLTIATTHTIARYVLPDVVEKFVAQYPDVKLVLQQSDPEEVCAQVDLGDADLAISTDTPREYPNLIKLDCFDLHRCVVAPAGHPILTVPKLTVKAIADYPIITYDQRYSSSWKVMQAFTAKGLEPKVVMSGIDADVCKTYVSKGLGIGILAETAYDPKRDVGLEIRNARHLFPSSTVKIALRPNTYLRQFLLDFVQAVEPKLTPHAVRRRVRDFKRAAAEKGRG